MSGQTDAAPEPVKQSIEELQRRYENLNRRKIQAETNLDHAKNRLQELKEEARAKYGTDHVDELRQQLKKMTEENEEKRRKYQFDLDLIERDLATVEENVAASESPPSREEKNS